ncbi:hypothetical protein R3P38DRAFT_3438546 [Favolaschia claudopus]|uniref:SET domain-containing protein n=1 Tax=Favolaschia claudopus TaxID=2862362 RepID=A0AAV9ZRX4_9AGAR
MAIPNQDGGETVYIDASDIEQHPGGSINHSCAPNAEAQLWTTSKKQKHNRVFIVAIKDIGALSEITIDYGGDYSIDPCLCQQCLRHKDNEANIRKWGRLIVENYSKFSPPTMDADSQSQTQPFMSPGDHTTTLLAQRTFISKLPQSFAELKAELHSLRTEVTALRSALHLTSPEVLQRGLNGSLSTVGGVGRVSTVGGVGRVSDLGLLGG